MALSRFLQKKWPIWSAGPLNAAGVRCAGTGSDSLAQAWSPIRWVGKAVQGPVLRGRHATSSFATGGGVLPWYTRTVPSSFRNVHSECNFFQELDRMPIPSIAMIVDASPKAKMDASCQNRGCFSFCCNCRTENVLEVWCPLIVVNKTLISWVLQRMSDIHFSTVSNEMKMKEGEKVMDDMATRFLEPDSKNKAVSKMQPGGKYSHAGTRDFF